MPPAPYGAMRGTCSLARGGPVTRRLLLIAAAVLACASVAVAHPESGPGKGHPATADGLSVVFHQHRFHKLIRSAYAPERWRVGPKRSDIRSAQVHRRAILIDNVRDQLGDFRDRQAAKFKREVRYREQWGTCEDSPPAGSQSVLDCLAGAGVEYGVSYDWLYRIAVCESHLDPNAHNASGASGLMQFLPSTWGTTPYGGESIWSARWSALAAAWMFRQGRAGEWSCN